MNADERRFVAKEKYSEAIEYAHNKGVKVLISTPRIVKDLKELEDSRFPIAADCQ